MKLNHDPLTDPTVISYIDVILKLTTVGKLKEVTQKKLDTAWRSWMIDSSYNTVDGLDKFKYSAFSPGTTDAFGEFISRYPNRRIRSSKSDFVLTTILAKSYGRNILNLEDGELNKQDCVIMSFPFSGNGSYYPEYNTVFDQADKLNVPVFIDGAYFGISHGIDYPLDRDCVKDFAISLSKNFAGNPFRLGIRFTKDLVDDGITAGLIGSDIFDRLGSFISIELMKQFSHNWLIEKYKKISDDFCKKSNLNTTNTLTIGLGGPDMFEFKRGDYIRVCITQDIS